MATYFFVLRKSGLGDAVLVLPKPLPLMKRKVEVLFRNLGNPKSCHFFASEQMAAKHWCFTDFDMSNSPRELCEVWEPLVEYCVFQKEWTEAKKDHYQGYVELKKPFTLNQIRKIRRGVHFAKRKGTPTQARDYCMWDKYPMDYRKEHKRGVQKRHTGAGDNGPWEVGVWKPVKGNQGKRTDLTCVAEMISEGQTLRKVAKRYPESIIRYGSGIRTLISCQKPPVKPKPKVYWFYGASGTGKTHKAEAEGGLADYKIARTNPDPARIFDQYVPGLTKRFIFENFHKLAIRHDQLIQYLDERRIMVKTMYDTKWFYPEEIYITCTYAPSDMWSGNELAEVTRRLTVPPEEFTQVYTPPTEPVTPEPMASFRCD